MDPEQIFNFFQDLYFKYGFPLGVVTTIAVILLVLAFPSHTEKWVGILARLISRFVKRVDYFATKLEIQSQVNSFVAKLESSTKTTFPRVTIRWQARGKEEIVFEEGEAIIVMRDQKHRNKNLVRASYLFTSSSLLRKTSRHLSKTQKKSLDLYTTQLMLESNKSAQADFVEDYVAPEIDSNEKIGSLFKKYVSISRAGLFFPVLIQELHFLGRKVFLEGRSDEIVQEVHSLISFLEEFSQREVGDIGTSSFATKYSRCTIRIVAAKEKRDLNKDDGYVSDLCKMIDANSENIYVIGSGKPENALFMSKVVRKALQERPIVEIRKKYTFGSKINIDGSRVAVVTHLIHLHNPSAMTYIYDENFEGV